MEANVEEEAVLKFAKRLASNEKKYRDRAVKKLRQWLKTRSGLKNAFTYLELLKLWKGLHYCFWMSDKPLVQEELADTLAKLIHSLQTFEVAANFVEAFLDTEAREWPGIDYLRIDKFMMLIRRFYQETLVYLKNNGWNDKQIDKFVQIFSKTVLNLNDEKIPNGLNLHFIDMYLKELAKIGAEDLTSEKVLQFIEPCCAELGQIIIPGLRRKVFQRVFGEVLHQAEVLHMVGQNEEMEEGSENEEDLEEIVEDKGRKTGGNKKTQQTSQKDTDFMEDENEDEGVGSDDGENDMELGEDDDEFDIEDTEEDEEELPILDVDLKKLVDMVTSVSKSKNCLGKNRKRIAALANRLRDASEGTFVEYEMSDVSDDEVELRRMTDKASANLVKTEQQMYEEDQLERKMGRLEYKKKKQQAAANHKSADAETNEKIEAKNKFKSGKGEKSVVGDDKAKKSRVKKKKRTATEIESAPAEQLSPPVKNKSNVNTPAINTTKGKKSVVAEDKTKENPVKKKKPSATEESAPAEQLSPPVKNKSNDDTPAINTTKGKKPVVAEGKANENRVGKKKRSAIEMETVIPTSTEQLTPPVKNKSKVDTSAINTTKVVAEDKTRENSVKQTSVVVEDKTRENSVKQKKRTATEMESASAEQLSPPVKKKFKVDTPIINTTKDTKDEKKLNKEKRKSAPVNGGVDFMKFEVGKTPPPAFVKRALVKAKSQSETKNVKKKNTGSPAIDTNRRVSFGLHRNCAQSTEEYVSSLKSTPDVPFNPQSKPNTGILKATPTRKSPKLTTPKLKKKLS